MFHTGYKPMSSFKNSSFWNEKLTDVPPIIDWRNEGAVTPIKFQGVCVVGFGENEDGIKYWWVKNSWGAKWDEGGYMRLRKDVGFPEGLCGIAMYASYPVVPVNSEEDLLKAVSRQPVSIAIDGSGAEFMNYQSGVFSPTDCGTTLTHAVTAVGYGTTEDGTKHWLLKNQWGESWGENGYMKILRDAGAPEVVCGLAQYASYPTA
ncbi:unnamed protein product [Prunus armeniaca]